ncbi:MAG: hypothetical protein KQJ78_00140 [Deltaproteobacteria bacterium]|nr:hypothetical protein [Deltaproteobacteria bacterium]
MLAPGDLFDLEGLTHAALFDGVELVWEALDKIKDFTRELVRQAGPQGDALRLEGGEILARTVVIHQGQMYSDDFQLLGGDPTKGQMRVRLLGHKVADAAVIHAGAMIMSDDVYFAPGVVVEPGALIKGPTFVGPCSEVRQGAYLRGACLVGASCVVGHTTEMKNTVMLDGAKAGHFAYLGDSILGREVNLGAGTKLANLKMLERPTTIRADGQEHRVTRRKFGAILGDWCQTGCNSVTNPGVILGPRSLVSPCLAVPSGFHKPRTVLR